MATRAKHGSYLFQRPESRMWWLRLRSPEKTTVHSLRTPDKAQAEILALPLIGEHKAALLAARPRVEPAWRSEYTPGLHNGGRVYATERELQDLDENGQPIGLPRPNGKMDWRAVGNDRLGIGGMFVGKMIDVDESVAERPSLPTKDSDDALLDTYVVQANLTGTPKKAAESMWYLFKQVVGKPLAKCTREDGRKIVAHLEATKKLKSTTLKRYMTPLIAICNRAIKDGKHTGINPFVDCVPNKDDSDRVLPFTDDDAALMHANLHKLSEADRLLLRFLACTGVRRGEAFQIAGEQVEHGVRFVLVGTKTEQSLRRLPLPAGVLPFVPTIIKGPLFMGRRDNAIKRLGKWMRDIGIDVAQKAPAHSFRHRMQDRLRSVGCPTDIRWELLGHERKTVAAGYGVGSPVAVLRKWLDKAAAF